MRILIVEDLPPVAKSLERAVRRIFDERRTSLKAIDWVADLDAAVDFLSDSEIDLLLLDLNLGGEDGFDVLRWATSAAFHTIVVSANTHRALEAFEHGVLDFVPKPAAPERLEQAIGRALDGRPNEQAANRLCVRRRGGVVVVPTASVRLVRGAGKYSELLVDDGRRLLHQKSLDRLAELLPDSFFRVHKSYLVDLRRVDELRVEPGGRYTLRLDDGSEVPVGRTRYPELRRRLNLSRDTQRPSSGP